MSNGASERTRIEARYDVSKTPDVLDYLRLAKLPVDKKARLNAAVHVVVAHHIAMDDATVVPATLHRLMREELDRHDAITSSLLAQNHCRCDHRTLKRKSASMRSTTASLAS